MVCVPGFSPAGWLLPLLLLQASAGGTAVSRFFVVGPDKPIKVLLGKEVALPCQLHPKQNVAHMHIRWYRAQLSPAVLVFQNGQEQTEEQMPEYRGRTQLMKDGITRGSVALRIQHAQASDNGQYWCQFTDGADSSEASMELQVIGMGSAPHVGIMGIEKDGIRVLCSSDGWFPEPKVQWKTLEGTMLQAASESQRQDGDGLFHVEASLVVTDRNLGKVTCSIRNLLYDEERASAIPLPEPFFPRESPWKLALSITLPLLLLLLAGISYTGWREHQAKQKAIKTKEFLKSEQIRKEMETVRKKRDDLQKDLGARKALYKQDWKKAQVYPDWRKELFQQAPVIIREEVSHQDGSNQPREEDQALVLSDPQSDDNLITLPQEGLMSGRCHWEVDVSSSEEWTLGIYEQHREGSGSPEKKFRVLQKKEGRYSAFTFCSQSISEKHFFEMGTCPQKIAIFLDYEDSDVSFYNMTDKTHIFSFKQASFLGPLYPYFKQSSMVEI